MRLGDHLAPAVHGAVDVAASGHEVRLGEPFEGGTRGREGGESVVLRIVRGVMIRHRTHRDDIGNVSGTPMVMGFGPPFPTDAATTMPAFHAFVMA